MQPFSHNALRPCPIIDHPKVMRTALKRFNECPTHEGVERTFTELADGLDEYSREVEGLYTPIWEQEYVGARKRACYARRDRVMTAAPQ